MFPTDAQIGVLPLDSKLTRPTIVLFDLDGTLVQHVNPRVLQILEFLDDCSHRTGRLVARFRLRRRQRQAALRKAPRLFVHRAIHRVRRKSVEEMLQPCQTMRCVLERLRENGVALGLVSNGLGRGYGHDVLEAFDLRRFFNACVFREDVSRGKPSPDSLAAALKNIGRPLRRNDVIWYIGDQRKDITAALAASDVVGRTITPVALGARAGIAALELRLGADQVMWSAEDLEGTVKSLFAPPDAAEMSRAMPAVPV